MRRALIIVALLAVLIPSGAGFTNTIAARDVELDQPQSDSVQAMSTSVINPGCNRILFDETHGWAVDSQVGNYTIGDGFSELADLLRGYGHIVDSLQDPNPFDFPTLNRYEVLVLMLPKEYYSPDEKAIIGQFVNAGGRLVTVGDNGGFSGVSLDILNDVHDYLGDGLHHNSDAVYDPTDNEDGRAYWPLIHTFSPDPINNGISTIVEALGSSLQVSGPAFGTAFGDEDTYTLSTILAASTPENSVSGSQLLDAGWMEDLSSPPTIIQPAAGGAPDARRAPPQVGFSTPLRTTAGTEKLVEEGFEGGVVPPAGWEEAVTNATYNWEIGSHLPHTGTYSAHVYYDPVLTPQDEWLVSPQITLSQGTLSF